MSSLKDVLVIGYNTTGFLILALISMFVIIALTFNLKEQLGLKISCIQAQ
jgi:hypothetical protein